MLSAVLDTNIIVSAHLRPGGRQDLILALGLSQRFLFCITEAIFDEYQRVLSRKRFRLQPEAVAASLERIRQVARIVVPRTSLEVATDPTDDKFLECAVEAGAEYLVTGNLRHFPKQYLDVRIVSPFEFEMILGEEFKRRH